MIEYIEDGDLAVYDNRGYRRDKKTGYYLNSTTRKRLHRAVWENERGSIPEGYHIHHLDKNKRNNCIDNLCLLPGGKHTSIHLTERIYNNYEEQVKHLSEIRPLASAWHSSSIGRAWHKQHYEGIRDKLHVIKTYTCEQCGKGFSATQTKPRFCSNACKSKWRRDAKLDLITKKCAFCGNEFISNKYYKKQTCCRKCGIALGHQKIGAR